MTEKNNIKLGDVVSGPNTCNGFMIFLVIKINETRCELLRLYPMYSKNYSHAWEHTITLNNPNIYIKY